MSNHELRYIGNEEIRQMLMEILSVKEYVDLRPDLEFDIFHKDDAQLLARVTLGNKELILHMDSQLTYGLYEMKLGGECEYFKCAICGRMALVVDESDERWNIGTEFRGESLGPICPECEGIFVDNSEPEFKLNIEPLLQVVKDSLDLDHKTYTNEQSHRRAFALKILSKILR